MKSFFNMPESIKKIISVFIIFLEMRLMRGVNNCLNLKAVNEYHQIVENFSEFLNDQNIKDVQQIYEYYNYAMWNGYFSKSHKLKYSLDRKVFGDNAGMAIMSGSSVCLNYADMLSLIFNELGFKSYVNMCYVNTDKVKINKIRTDKDITRDMDYIEESFLDKYFVNNISKLTGNHAIVCVEDNNELYFFDPTNFAYLSKTSLNNLAIENGDGKFDLKYITSLLLGDVNLFKMIPFKNKENYKEQIINKEEIDINIEDLENFYKSNENTINNIVNNTKYSGNFLSFILYTLIACYIFNLIRKLIDKIFYKIQIEEKTNIFPKIKEYFNEKTIKTEFESLKNYELLNNTVGIKNSFTKELLKKSLNIVSIIINGKNFYHLALVMLLNHLGYDATYMKGVKYNNKIIKKDIPLIIYFNNNDIYLYDYEIEELLYKENNEFYSLDKKYKYKINSEIFKYYNNNLNRDLIENKMNKENTILSKQDIKILRKNKTLRK